MMNLTFAASRNNWRVDAVAKDAEIYGMYHVLVYRNNAPFEERPYSLHTYFSDDDSFVNGRYDLSEVEAYDQFRNLNW